MGPSHSVAMLSAEGLKTFILPHRNSFPNIINSKLRVRNLLSMANMAAVRIRPILTNIDETPGRWVLLHIRP